MDRLVHSQVLNIHPPLSAAIPLMPLMRKWARINIQSFLEICLGLQCAVDIVDYEEPSAIYLEFSGSVVDGKDKKQHQ